MIESAQGKLEGILAFRLPSGADVFNSIESVCEENDIKDGVIMSALGNLRKVTFCNPTILQNGKVGYGESTLLEGVYELINLSGMICHDSEGKILPHIHLTISDEQNNAYGGHMQPGCETLTTTDIVIGKFSGMEMGRRFDEELGLPLFAPKTCALNET